MPDLSIIIVNYNTREPLRRCLDSIRATRGDLSVEVIVVDNGSRDDSPAMVREFAAAVEPDTGLDVILELPGYNSWFTGGNNIGLKRATGDYALILNPDTVLLPDALPNLIAYLRDHPGVGAVSPRQRFPGGDEIMICSMTPRYPDLLVDYTFLGMLLAPWRKQRRAQMWYAGWDRTISRAVEVVPDSSLLAATALLRDLGGLDTALKLYFTEDDICRRIIDTGQEVHLCADAMLEHEENASVSQVQRLASQAYFDDLITFAGKYYGGPAALLLRLLVWPTRRGMDLVQRLRGEKRSLG
jgi:N-acetylglucosaminyl-diphospho-decaprenol L-rhamnosyltransferase